MFTSVKYIIIVLCLTSITSAQLFGQEWSAQQKEVWKNVQTYWDLDAKRDIEGFMSYFHSDYCGWFSQGRGAFIILNAYLCSYREWITKMKLLLWSYIL